MYIMILSFLNFYQCHVHVSLILVCLISYNNPCNLRLAEFCSNGFHIKSSMGIMCAATENISVQEKKLNYTTVQIITYVHL